MHWYFLISSIILPLVSTCLLYALLFPYIFLLFDCFEWALIDCIEKCRGHSALWQFQMGGSITYIFLLFDCFKWALIDCIEKCRGHLALWQFQMGGGQSLISSYYLTVSNGHSLTILKSIEVTQHSGSFEWEGGSKGRFTLNLPILSSLAISCFASQKVFSHYIRKT